MRVLHKLIIVKSKKGTCNFYTVLQQYLLGDARNLISASACWQ